MTDVESRSVVSSTNGCSANAAKVFGGFERKRKEPFLVSLGYIWGGLNTNKLIRRD